MRNNKCSLTSDLEEAIKMRHLNTHKTSYKQQSHDHIHNLLIVIQDQ